MHPAIKRLSHWGISEYFYLVVLWAFLTIPLYLMGWGWWSIASLPLLLLVVTLLTLALTPSKPVFVEHPDVYLIQDGFQYQTSPGAFTPVKWSEIAAIEFDYGPWLPDVWGVFPDTSWNIVKIEGGVVRVHDKSATREILLPALTKNLPNFSCNYDALEKEAFSVEGNDGTIHCWTRGA